jgi:DMSO/TMAO reductase YedYZ molybdopterin-dependent catalytic subunit
MWAMSGASLLLQNGFPLRLAVPGWYGRRAEPWKSSGAWDATPGAHVLECRATDANGYTQTLEPPWDAVGFGNNAVHRVPGTVR